MIFSQDKWIKGGEQDAYVPAGASLSFSKVAPSLRHAQEMYATPLLGLQLTSEMEDAYRTDKASDEMASLIRMVQEAVVNLALWQDFDLLQTRITDQGFQRQGSEDWQQPYKYQEDRMKEVMKNRGFNGLDRVLDYLYSHTDQFPSFMLSAAYEDRRDAVVRSVREVERMVYVGGSCLVFLRLRTEFATVEETRLMSVMGRSLYEQFRQWLREPGTFPEEECNCTLEELRMKCAAVVVRWAVARVVRQTGTLTDRGLYFDALQSGGQDNRSRQPASDQAIGDRLSLYDSDARVAEDSLRRYLNRRLPGLYEGKGQNHIIRDNDKKQAFFAM